MYERIAVKTLALGLVLLLAAVSVMAQDNATNLRRISAEFQNNQTVGGIGEISTNAVASAGGVGGTPVYTKTFGTPDERHG